MIQTAQVTMGQTIHTPHVWSGLHHLEEDCMPSAATRYPSIANWQVNIAISPTGRLCLEPQRGRKGALLPDHPVTEHESVTWDLVKLVVIVFCIVPDPYFNLGFACDLFRWLNLNVTLALSETYVSREFGPHNTLSILG